MIIPDNLTPFPILPQSSDAKKVLRSEIDSFVSEDAIQKLLVGPMLVTPLHATRVPNGGGYAGRDDLSTDDESPFVTLSSDSAYPDEVSERFEPGEPHPALATPRSAAPPIPRIEPEKGFGRHDRSDRWWVLGMGVALLVILGSGALVELISNEAVRRARISPTAEQVELPAVTLPGGKKRTSSQPLAASNPEYPAP